MARLISTSPLERQTMTDPFNPYTPPQANLNPQGTDGGCWREGRFVVVAQGGDLPPRCINCNALAETPIKRRIFSWHHPAIYLLMPVVAVSYGIAAQMQGSYRRPNLSPVATCLPYPLAALIYLIVAAMVRKRATLSPGLCGKHRRRRIHALLAGLFGLIAGFFLFMVGASMDSDGVAPLGLLLVVGGFVAAFLMEPAKLSAVRITGTLARLKGAGPAFLDSLPRFDD